ncbi:MAG: ATP-binding protein [Clostridia bacterium]|nr:ATP-binding protein [Clostridia bacterium]
MDRREIEHWTAELLTLLDTVDSLLFSGNEIEVEAIDENLPKVQAFIARHLAENDCPMKARMQIEVAAEEIFVNIAHYAYTPLSGKATVRVEFFENPMSVSITFMDHGIPYDPLAHREPDVALSAAEREIGGLGIFMTKKIMDDVAYEYRNGQNILTLKKNL